MRESKVVDRVRQTIRRHRLASSSTRVIAALSGGPDSVALLHLLRALSEAGELQLVAVAHFNHRLRDAADADERFCIDLASRLSIPIVTDSADVRAAAVAAHRSIEDAAHRLRYAFFERAAAEYQAHVVALGHTREDQAETVLLRLLRGAGTRGLGGMYPKHGMVVRPLIDCRRSELRAYLLERDIPFVHDASNDDVAMPRNRVRSELLPLIQQRFNPNVVDVLAAEASLAQADHDFLDRIAANWDAEHARRGAGTWSHECALLTDLPLAIARRVLYRALTEASGGRLIGFDDVERVWAVVSGELPRFDAPGQHVERVGGDVVLRSEPADREPRGRAARPPGFWYPLSVPGTVGLPEVGALVSAELAETGSSAEMCNGGTSEATEFGAGSSPDRGNVALIRADLVRDGLAVRNRRPGDRLKPSPAGHRKLQDLFVDRKVPRTERDRIPVVVDVNGRIVWVVGHGIDGSFRVTDPAQPMVVLRFKVVGGSF